MNRDALAVSFAFAVQQALAEMGAAAVVDAVPENKLTRRGDLVVTATTSAGVVRTRMARVSVERSSAAVGLAAHRLKTQIDALT